MVPWSCHCQLALRAGRQHPGQFTGGGKDGVAAEAADVAWAVKPQEALRTATMASTMNQPITLVLAVRTCFIEVDTLRLGENRTSPAPAATLVFKKCRLVGMIYLPVTAFLMLLFRPSIHRYIPGNAEVFKLHPALDKKTIDDYSSLSPFVQYRSMVKESLRMGEDYMENTVIGVSVCFTHLEFVCKCCRVE